MRTAARWAFYLLLMAVLAFIQLAIERAMGWEHSFWKDWISGMVAVAGVVSFPLTRLTWRSDHDS